MLAGSFDEESGRVFYWGTGTEGGWGDFVIIFYNVQFFKSYSVTFLNMNVVHVVCIQYI